MDLKEKLESLNVAEQRRIQALLIALMELDSPLSDDLQNNVDNIVSFLPINHEIAMNHVGSLLDKDDRLQELYLQARDSLKQAYTSQERDKSDAMTIAGNTPLSFAGVTIAILEAGNELGKVRDDLYKKLGNPIKSNENDQSFTGLLAKAMTIGKQKEKIKLESVLKALEFHPLTIQDLAYSLNISIEECQILIKRLWDQGKINTLESSSLGNIFPFLRNKKRVSEFNKAKTQFTLTSRGHFQLHPVIKY